MRNMETEESGREEKGRERGERKQNKTENKKRQRKAREAKIDLERENPKNRFINEKAKARIRGETEG